MTLGNAARTTLKVARQSDSQEGRLARLASILGADFGQNAIEIDKERDGIVLSGFAGLPTYSRGNSQHQFLFVNGRPVKDRLLHGALRGAYQDFLARDRHPVVALYIDLPSDHVDVNVHPAKTEVRFRNPGLVLSAKVEEVGEAYTFNSNHPREGGDPESAHVDFTGRPLGAARAQLHETYVVAQKSGHGGQRRRTPSPAHSRYC